MEMKYNGDTYKRLGLFIVENQGSHKGYKVQREDDGCIFETPYRTKQEAQNWIDNIVDIFNQYNVKY